MYECDAEFGPPEKYPEMSVQRAFVLMSRWFERESRGCEAVGETHEFIEESRNTIAVLDARKKVIGDVAEALYDGKARFTAPAVLFTSRIIW